MILKIQHFVLFVTIGWVMSCRPEVSGLAKIEAHRLTINDSIISDQAIETFIIPYRKRVNEVLDSTLAFAPKTISKDDGIYNTPAGNLMADIVLEQAEPVFHSRTGKHLDFVLLNHGGIRSIISKGPVSARTAYEVMPFENNIAVVELSGKSVQALVEYLVRSKRAHPIAGLQVILDKNDEIRTITIRGKDFDAGRTYYVATSDYLTMGGDSMVFFKDALSVTSVDYLIRNAMIDYFKKVDTLNPVIDNRYYKME
ncbi:hypothetical protein FK220_008155 [Flavobacteriaceae bacterium TP-CH-4]|uniref:5'-Nucleotidase C-terminal domain-containing protein n=1 Tax=Pelagihabitans pacificus TaxID=2696054 RepID=A0A967AS13_9FLAO|nr:5'-nucleotidase [Pelagihabitans pacificus]NHF59309.1 hypothetical protein [Pelagihabitans pacificus]